MALFLLCWQVTESGALYRGSEPQITGFAGERGISKLV